MVYLHCDDLPLCHEVEMVYLQAHVLAYDVLYSI
jgi:hypothetical protein